MMNAEMQELVEYFETQKCCNICFRSEKDLKEELHAQLVFIVPCCMPVCLECTWKDIQRQQLTGAYLCPFNSKPVDLTLLLKQLDSFYKINDQKMPELTLHPAPKNNIYC